MRAVFALALTLDGASALMFAGFVRPAAAPRVRPAMADQEPGMSWEEYVKLRDAAGSTVAGGTMDQVPCT